MSRIKEDRCRLIMQALYHNQDANFKYNLKIAFIDVVFDLRNFIFS